MKRKLLTLGVALIFTLSATLSAFAAANPAKIPKLDEFPRKPKP